ncbi:MAG TPA: proline dehydrogenase family protein, partial [Candidatus Sulfotelmatobacter sp.]|nr:proline dehydrogenase family protein [Candidatus Sulfotelmatobacter sp.]
MTQVSDREVTDLARRIAQPASQQRSAVIRSSWWSERMLEWAMSHPSFKTELFQFVDVLPAVRGSDEVMRHLSEYFSSAELPRALDLVLEAVEHLPLGRAAAAGFARHEVGAIARQFIVGSDADDAVAELERLWRSGVAFTVDLLGEKTVTEDEADGYVQGVDHLLSVLGAAAALWPSNEKLERDDIGEIPRVNVSVKPSALTPHYAPLTLARGLAEARERIRPVLTRAKQIGAFINIDMEHYEVKDLTLQLFRALLEEHEFEDLELGIAVQAYLVDSQRDLTELIELSSRRSHPLTVRLVKGAYWDTEVVIAHAEGWRMPVFENKAQTDANYERCVRLLHDNHGRVRAAFGTHNPRSLAYAATYARSVGIPDSGYEFQTLYGMAEPIQQGLATTGVRRRVYAPVGQLIPGMAYLVRRLLENTSNESFIRRRFVEGADIEALVRPPQEVPPPQVVGEADRPEGERVATDAHSPGPYRHEPVAEWRRSSVRTAFAASVDAAAPHHSRSGPPFVAAFVGGRELRTEATIASVDPGDPETTVAISAACGRAEADEALEAARRALPAWSCLDVRERTDVLFRAAGWMRSRRREMAALQVYEAGKPWREADADVCEAIDFCEYYGRQALALEARAEVESPPGERNRLIYQARGVGVVISPWNFPLAIPTGMVVAALVTGNCVLFKPAEQTPAVAAQLVGALRAGGLPDGVLSFLPGIGEELGPHLFEHPDVSFVAFTGSKAVGLEILSKAAVHHDGQRQVKRVIAEMGGKNAIVVDADADLDQAIPIITASAFGHAGQKCSACSRLIVMDSVYEQLMSRLVGATKE